MNKKKQGVLLLVLTLVVAAFLYAAAVHAATPPKAMMATDQNGNSVTLFTDEQCTLFTLKGWKRAALQYNGKRLNACWVVTLDMVAMVVDEEGDVSRVPVQAFRSLVES